MERRIILILLAVLPSVALSLRIEENGGSMTVSCSRDLMTIRVPSLDFSFVSLDKWGLLPGCEFTQYPTHHEILLPLSEDLPCGTTRVRSYETGSSLYYHQVLLTPTSQPSKQERVMVKCSPPKESNATVHNIVKRDLPPGFTEPDYIEITSEVTGTAPVPVLNVGVRQDGSLVEGAINVHPGTPLTMEVYLDNKSAGTYGILVSFLEVTDNKNKDETIVYNGCTIDPNLFENFVTESGDFLAAKFRAFKFPESNFVLFRGTVDVCLDKCQGITCSDGRIGFGRKKRNIHSSQSDPNKLFQVTMTTFIKFSEQDAKNHPSEVIIEERLKEKLALSGLSTGIVHREHKEPPTFTRRSPHDPPSIAFSGSGKMSTLSSLLLPIAMILFARRILL